MTLKKEDIKCSNCLNHFDQYESWEVKALGVFEKKYNPTHEVEFSPKGKPLCFYSFTKMTSEKGCDKCKGKIKSNQEGDIETHNCQTQSSQMNNCAKCEVQYKEAKEKVQSEPNKYELKDKKDCPCQHRFNPTRCSIRSCYLNNKEQVYINESGKEVNEQGQEHHQVCKGGISRGGSRQTWWTEFYKVKSGEVCETCQKYINERLKDWEVNAKKKVMEKCQNGNHGGFDGGELMWTTGSDKICCGKEMTWNNYGDVKPCQVCNNKNREPQTPRSDINIVQLLDQLERYFIENDIKLIKRENGKLVIEFNKENSTNNLTTEQQEQINSYLTKTNKSELSLSEVRQERERERERESKNPTNWTPLIIGGGIVLVIIVGIIVYLLTKNKENK